MKITENILHMFSDILAQLNSDNSGSQMSNNLNGCLILVSLSLTILSEKPAKESKIGRLVSKCNNLDFSADSLYYILLYSTVF